MIRSSGRLLALGVLAFALAASAAGQTDPAAPSPPSAPATTTNLADPAPPAQPLPPADTAPVIPLQVPEISWQVENSFRFFTDAADTEVHRATYLALTPEQQLRHPVLAAEQALSRRHEDGWAESMFRNTCWDVRTNRFVCPNGKDYINPKSHRVIARIDNVDEAVGLSCTWLTAPHGGEELRGKVVTQPCNEAVKLDVPYPAGLTVEVEIGGRTVATEDIRVRDLLIVGMGDSFASGEGNPDVPVHFSRERSASYGKRAKEGLDLTRLSGPRRALEADRRQGLHRGECALERSGVPPLALLASAARGAPARHRGPAPRRHLRRRRLLGLGGHLRPVPALHRQRVGAQPARPVADFAHRVRPVRPARSADAGSARSLSHERDHPRAAGRSRAEEVRSDQRAQDRSHVRLRRRQRRGLLAAPRQLGAVG